MEIEVFSIMEECLLVILSIIADVDGSNSVQNEFFAIL